MNEQINNRGGIKMVCFIYAWCTTAVYVYNVFLIYIYMILGTAIMKDCRVILIKHT